MRLSNAPEIYDIHPQTLLKMWNTVFLKRGDTQVSFMLGDGGHIESCEIHGIQMLYERFQEAGKPPKWGMPSMFPNAGPLTPEEIQESSFHLPQHGFGRISHWDLDETTGEQILIFSQNESFPFSGEVRYKIEITEKWLVRFIQTVKNTGEKNLPLASWFHPYFRIPNGNKDEITWDFEWGEKVFQDREIWKNAGTWKYDVPQNGKISFTIPELWTIQLDVSADYERFWVWSMPDKDFVCVEPVMGDEGKIVKDPILIPPGQSHTSFLEISLKK
jgi:galactose mutarotase-like enzyme